LGHPERLGYIGMVFLILWALGIGR